MRELEGIGLLHGCQARKLPFTRWQAVLSNAFKKAKLKNIASRPSHCVFDAYLRLLVFSMTTRGCRRAQDAWCTSKVSVHSRRLPANLNFQEFSYGPLPWAALVVILAGSDLCVYTTGILGYILGIQRFEIRGLYLVWMIDSWVIIELMRHRFISQRRRRFQHNRFMLFCSKRGPPPP